MASSDTTCMLLEGGVLMMEVSGDYYKGASCSDCLCDFNFLL